MTKFSDLLSDLAIHYDKLIILGDFNIHIDIKDDPLTVSFLSLLESVGFTQHVSGPTHRHNHTLDLVITRGVQIHNLIISPQNQSISDHCLITFELPGVELDTQERNIETRCLNPSAIHKFTTLLPNASFIKTGSADELLNNFNNTLSTALDTVAPLRTRQIKPTKHSTWFDEHTRSECRRCKRKWRETKLEVFHMAWNDSIVRYKQPCPLLQVINIVCPEKRALFSNISLSANTVAEQINELSGIIHYQLCEKAKMFSAYITTDGAPSMTGRKNGLVVLVQRKLEDENVESVIVLHCIIHQHALCSKCFKFDNMMFVVIKCINYIRSLGLQHRQFHAFLEEIESAYGDVLYFTEVCWLSRGCVLKRFFDLRTEVKTFMEEGRLHVPELDDSQWVMDLAFLVDITQELCNLKLQGPGQLVTIAFDNVKALSTKLRLWKTQHTEKNLSHFPACRYFVEGGTPFSGEEYAAAIEKLLQEFDQRFADFKTHASIFQMFADPFSVDVDSAPSVLQMELIDLQCNTELKAKFREAQGKADMIGQFLRELPPSFPELSKMFKWIMCLFGSTYLCEKLFSTMTFNKSKYRSRLSDAHLQAILRVSTANSLRANVAHLCEQKHRQMSGSKQ
ncbi:GTD2B protein, partial [Amia calva]|nr:GTD2B protein [Amia calva]